MAKAILNTLTTFEVSNNVKTISSFYSEDSSYLYFLISESPTNIGGVEIKQGELFFTSIGNEDLDFNIDENGNLLVHSSNPDIFSINENGELIIEV